MNSQSVPPRDEAAPSGVQSDFVPKWGAQAPKGARAVVARIIKEGANVPLFLGQTLVNALRDLGYNHTTSAICEHVDNAIQWEAREIRVYFHETGRKDRKRFDVVVFDDGQGMAPHVLKAAMSFGGSMNFENRSGIGRYGIGMKAAALSLGPVLDVFSWQQPRAYYRMGLDVEAIGNDRSNVIQLPEPQFLDELPEDLVTLLTQPTNYPRNGADSQDLLAPSRDALEERLGDSGTIVYIPDCDRLTYKSAKTLVDHATKEMAHIYRRQLSRGLRLYINNRRVEPFDPMYWLEESRHTKVEGLTEKRSRLVESWELQLSPRDGDVATYPVKVRLYCLPYADWDRLQRKVQKNDLRIFDSPGISFMRSEREVHLAHVPAILGKFRTLDFWWRLEIEFPAELDEAFGVAVNKQGVRPKEFVTEAIRKAIHEEVVQIRKTLARHQSLRAAENSKAQVSEAERRATEAEAVQTTVLADSEPKTEAERHAHEEALRTLATTYRRENESIDEAVGRIRASRYITHVFHDEDAPFYRVEFRIGKVILLLNSAHPFYDKLYRPLIELTRAAGANATGGMGAQDTDGDETPVDAAVAALGSEALVSLQMLFFALGRTQSALVSNDSGGEHRALFDKMRKQWSLDLENQLSTK